MAIYRIYPLKDSFISSEVPESNQGLDEILEIGTYVDISGTSRVNRTLIKFKDSDISDAINSKISSGSEYEAILGLYIAEASELPTSFNIECYPIAEDWQNGVGKFGDNPTNTSGVSWRYVDSQLTSWTLPTASNYTTSSYQLSIPGGGNWYTGSVEGNLSFSQSLELYGDLDLRINVTTAIQQFYDSSVPNYGFVLKLEEELEFDENTNIRLRYFGRDTNTVFCPYLEFKWDDLTFITGSLTSVGTSDNTLKVSNLKKTYSVDDRPRLRIHSRPTYPTRVFTTSSIYLQNYFLPQDTLWGIRDIFSHDFVIPFDDLFTKVSTDTQGSYFDMYMSNLYIDRYYEILIKTNIEGSEIIHNLGSFKVIK